MEGNVAAFVVFHLIRSHSRAMGSLSMVTTGVEGQGGGGIEAGPMGPRGM